MIFLQLNPLHPTWLQPRKAKSVVSALLTNSGRCPEFGDPSLGRIKSHDKSAIYQWGEKRVR